MVARNAAEARKHFPVVMMVHLAGALCEGCLWACDVKCMLCGLSEDDRMPASVSV